MVLGKEIRLNRILKKGKMLCIPLDHGISSGPLKGIQNISELIYQTQDSGLTCFLVNKGIIKSLPAPPSIGINCPYVSCNVTWSISKQQDLDGLSEGSDKVRGRCCLSAY